MLANKKIYLTPEEFDKIQKQGRRLQFTFFLLGVAYGILTLGLALSAFK